MFLPVDKPERPTSLGVFRALAAFMRGDAGFKVVGDARIKALIPAFENINCPVHKTMIQRPE